MCVHAVDWFDRTTALFNVRGLLTGLAALVWLLNGPQSARPLAVAFVARFGPFSPLLETVDDLKCVNMHVTTHVNTNTNRHTVHVNTCQHACRHACQPTSQHACQYACQHACQHFSTACLQSIIFGASQGFSSCRLDGQAVPPHSGSLIICSQMFLVQEVFAVQHRRALKAVGN